MVKVLGFKDGGGVSLSCVFCFASAAGSGSQHATCHIV